MVTHLNASPSVVLVDWGGVLTPPLGEVWHRWAELDGIDTRVFQDVISQWVAEDTSAAVTLGYTSSPMAKFERGQLSQSEFEQLIADEYNRRGHTITSAGLIDRMLAGTQAGNPAMFDLLNEISGVCRLGVLSNSWGDCYDRSQWGIFEHVIVSGEVGLRKPEPAIFAVACERFGVPAQECILIDDLPANIEAAQRVGMHGILYHDVESTQHALTKLLRHK